MVNLARLVETADHALFLLEEVASFVPGAKGAALRVVLLSVRKAFNATEIRQALEDVQAKYSAQAQAIADEWDKP